MPAISAEQIINAIEYAFAEAGASAILISKSREHPRQFNVTSGGSTFPVWVYIWTLTHGGGAARHPDEYRIQLTSVTPPLPQNPDGPTLLLGYEPNSKCFAGFDLKKHRTFSTQSPSIQININTLHEALRDGFAFSRKGNDEIAIGFRPDNMLAYCLNSESLHASGVDIKTSTLLTKVGRLEPVNKAELEEIPETRRRVVLTVSRLVRESDFRKKVTVAYEGRCCVTGLQLRLVDAAHILPVGAEGSIDQVKNGLCLSPTYHRAYDRGLIFLADDRKMKINKPKIAELVKLGLDGGLSDFKATLGKQIFLPADRQQWPDLAIIRKANKFRDL